MGRSIRSKLGKRLRTVKRQRVKELVDKPRMAESNRRCKEIMLSGSVSKKTASRDFSLGKKNSFRYGPIDTDAAAKNADTTTPQMSVKTPLDFRSSALPMAGYALRGNRRKFDEAEQRRRDAQAGRHPKRLIIAGKGKNADVHKDVMAVTNEEFNFFPGTQAAKKREAEERAAAKAAGLDMFEDDDADIVMPGDDMSHGISASMMMPEHLKQDSDTKRKPVQKNTGARAAHKNKRANIVGATKTTKGSTFASVKKQKKGGKASSKGPRRKTRGAGGVGRY